MKKKEKLTIVKVGGKIVEDEASLKTLLHQFFGIEGRKLLVHGGGRSATQMAARLGIETRMIEGRRVTDDEMLRVVTMVYGGLVNKHIVTMLQAEGLNAVGLTGADMDIVRSHRRPAGAVDYGWVGDVERVDAAAVATLVDCGYCPVVAPLTHDGRGNLLNTNADTMAAEIAIAMSERFEVTLVFCFEMMGVLADPENADSVIPVITPELYVDLKERGIVGGGMIPKLDNAMACVGRGVSSVVITRADRISDRGSGTRIRR